MSRGDRPALSVGLCVVLPMLLHACAVGSALSTQKGSDISSIVPGTTRSAVERLVGAPLREWRTDVGVRYCIYSRLGDAPPDIGVAAAFVGMDVVTMGIVEMVPLFTKVDAYERRHQHPMAVAYDSDEHVIGVFPNATEFDAFPEDGKPPTPTRR